MEDLFNFFVLVGPSPCKDKGGSRIYQVRVSLLHPAMMRRSSNLFDRCQGAAGVIPSWIEPEHEGEPRCAVFEISEEQLVPVLAKLCSRSPSGLEYPGRE